MLKVNELFSGIGAFRKALVNLNIPHEVVGISEIDKHAVKSYEAMYGQTRNYGDISKIDTLDYADLWTYGFPCQDVSIAGLKQGIVKNETRSGLLYEVKRLLVNSALVDELPKYLIMENVKNLVGKKFKSDFDKWLDWLSRMGYENYWQVLNAKDYGVAQNRERVFVISVLKEKSTLPFIFPKKQTLETQLKDYLEQEVDTKFYLTEKQIEKMKRNTFNRSSFQSRVCDMTRTSRALCARDFKGPTCILIGTLDMNGFESANRIYSDKGLSPTLTTCGGGNTEAKVELNGVIRKLTPREYWRLMGFSDSDFNKAANVCSNTQLYKQAGNSIVVNVLERILERLLFDDSLGGD